MKGYKLDISRVGIDQYKKKEKSKLKIISWIILLSVFCVVLIIGLSFLEQYFRGVYGLNYNSQSLSTWIGSLASYWGGIIGGILSGVIALGGTFIIIGYYRKSDADNKRIENQPFLKVILNDISDKTSEENVIFKMGEGNKHCYIIIVIKNIGKGFAQTLAYYNNTNLGGYKFTNTIEKGQLLENNFVIQIQYDNNSLDTSFDIMFLDCFTNEYIQHFDIIGESKNNKIIKESVEITSNYPVLTYVNLK